MKKNYIKIALRSKKDTKQIEYGRQFLNAMMEAEPRLEPEFFDCELERYNTTSYKNLDDALKRWTTRKSIKGYTQEVEGDWAAKWKRKKQPKYDCYMRHMVITKSSYINPGNFNFTSNWYENINWIKLFDALCKVSDAQIGMLHHFTPNEALNDCDAFELGSFGAWSNPRFPDISWAMMFGDDFAPRLNVDKLRELGFSADVVGSGILVRVTDDILDVSTRYDYFCERRELLRANLPHDFFTDPEEERRKVEEFTKMYLEHKGMTPK